MHSRSQPKKYPVLHRDGTVSYLSYFKQEWVEHSIHVPFEELEMMASHDRERVRRHLDYDRAESIPATS